MGICFKELRFKPASGFLPPLANGARVKGLVGNAHRRYELDMLFVFRIPSVKGLAVLLLKKVTINLHRAWPGCLPR